MHYSKAATLGYLQVGTKVLQRTIEVPLKL